MSKTVSIDGMAEAINEGLQEYAKLASSEVKRAVRKSAKTVKEQIEAGAPSRTGRYKSSWVTTKQEESSQSIQMVVHSKDRYQLAHLLEKEDTMTHAEVKAMVEEMGLPYAYDHFAEGESPDPPFICFLYPKAANFSADGIVYHHFNRLDIEVYTDYKDPDMEAAIEEVLTAHELFYEKSEVWIETEKMYEVLYELTV